jgi:hypothetical protein
VEQVAFRWVFLGGIAFVALAVVGAVIYFLMGGNKQPPGGD